ncbi:Holliday junction branch migration protein RuvA [Pseudooceanicola sp. CBS1P-1]|uniref:Holliday junction branch migration complex subunit RuvA n=1 Tax=Pseudooceanicola albus TaxID=2692189 RepID=A0A6L7G1G5_9RHOB|nr:MULTISPECIES: Holliday junction branch migration protein RuvA [Pseudooceanicola]MBT9382709.1 Holliday junction branch migration protein RuvA [Pseudooceanicola endophyticus]MXN17247.1 Holliday junction branch migration protein RuvA [Pseudooceanicola albus]
MIGKISGRVDYKALDHVLVDVRGVGYLVYCSDRTLAVLPGPGEAVALYTDMLVREDLLQLFGFTTLEEKEWYRLLLSVQGVGAKAALAILSALGPDGVGRAIALGDWNAVKAAKGVGPKTAQRVVNELKDKAPTVMAMGAQPAARPDPDALIEEATPAPAPVRNSRAKADPGPKIDAAARADALSALTNLGYQPSEAMQAVAQALDETPDANTSALIRAALRRLAPKD